jgi:hypothetical protein
MKSTIISLFFILILFINLHSQGIPYGVEFQINTTTYENQCNPSAACLTNGNFVFCWRGQDSDSYGIFGQRFNSSCEKLGVEFLINSDENLTQMQPFVSKLNNGRFVVCWISSDLTLSHDIYGQIYTEQGEPLGPMFSINSYTECNQAYPNICSLNSNGFFVCWQSYIVNQDWADYDISAQYFDYSGNKIRTEFVINTNNRGHDVYPKAVCLSNNDVVVCWLESYCNIHGQILSDSGIKKGNEFVIPNADEPSILNLDDSKFIICWPKNDIYDKEPHGIFAQIFDSLGNKIGDEIQIISSKYFQVLKNLKTATFSDSKIIVCWERSIYHGAASVIFAQILSKDGQKIGSDFLISTFSENKQQTPFLTSMREGGVIVCWSSYGQDGSKYGIFGKYLKEINHELIVFNLLEPNNDSYLQTNRIKLFWEQPSRKTEFFPWEITFDLYIDTDYNFSNPQIIKDIQDTTYTLDSLLAGKTYFWKVLAKNLAGDSLWSTQQDWGFFIKQGATLVESSESELPQNFELCQNYPNPFNSSTEIRYCLSNGKASYKVRLRIYDVLGRLVKVLVDQEQFAGSYIISWDGTDLGGNLVASGVYFYSLETGDLKLIRKMLVLQ